VSCGLSIHAISSDLVHAPKDSTTTPCHATIINRKERMNNDFMQSGMDVAWCWYSYGCAGDAVGHASDSQ